LKELLIATKNKDKCREVKHILKDLDLKFRNLLDFTEIETVKETGDTFRENADKKAVEYSKKTRMLTIADDSGLVVEKLDGRPGVYSSRFTGPDASDEENNKKLLNMLKKVPSDERNASFVCYIAIADSGRLVGGCEGRCDGYIALSIRGKTGFGYDPLFILIGHDKTFAELGPDIKNKLSHRYKALVKAKDRIKNYLKCPQ